MIARKKIPAGQIETSINFTPISANSLGTIHPQFNSLNEALSWIASSTTDVSVLELFDNTLIEDNTLLA